MRLFDRRFKKQLQKKQEEKEREYQKLVKEMRLRDEMGGVSSLDEIIERINGGTCSEHYGYVPNLFVNLSDEDLFKCLKSYYAATRGIGPHEPTLTSILDQYIDAWNSALKLDEETTENEKRWHAITACYVDLNREAASRFVQLHLSGQKNVKAEKENRI